MLPRPIYEALPYLYGAAGLLAIFNVDLVPGKISGALLLSAGVAIWHLRREYRG